MVKIVEVIAEATQDVKFDLVDDASFFMRNDPTFYRKEYFPTVNKIAELHRSGKKFDHKKHLGPVVEKGINAYCSKFDLANSPDDVFNQEHRDAIIDKLFSEEMEEINKGEYK